MSSLTLLLVKQSKAGSGECRIDARMGMVGGLRSGAGLCGRHRGLQAERFIKPHKRLLLAQP